MHMLDCPALLQLARCCRSLYVAADSSWAWVHVPAVPALFGKEVRRLRRVQSLLRHAALSVKWRGREPVKEQEWADITAVAGRLHALDGSELLGVQPEQWLRFFNLSVTAARPVGGLQRLRVLRIGSEWEECHLSADCVAALVVHCPNLHTLTNVFKPSCIPSSGLYDRLFELRSLTSLRASDSSRAPDSLIRPIALCAQLRHLRLDSVWKFSGAEWCAWLAGASFARGLERLSLSEVGLCLHDEREQLTDALSSYISLRWVELDDAGGQRAWLLALTALPRLELLLLNKLTSVDRTMVIPLLHAEEEEECNVRIRVRTGRRDSMGLGYEPETRTWYCRLARFHEENNMHPHRVLKATKEEMEAFDF
jgi:hypothetical protein